jgi:hypothetical protein
MGLGRQPHSGMHKPAKSIPEWEWILVHEYIIPSLQTQCNLIFEICLKKVENLFKPYKNARKISTALAVL